MDIHQLEETVLRAAEAGDLEAVQLGVSRGYELTESALRYICIRAGKGGSRNVIKWATQCGATKTADVCSCAAMGGHLELLKWLYENGWTITEYTCLSAVGELRVIKWLV